MYINYQKRSRTITLTSLLVIFLAGSSAVHANSQEATHYKFGVLPFMPMSALIKFFNAVGTDFTRQVNKRVIAQSRPTFKQFTEEIESETYDLIFIQPFDYPLAYSHNYRPMARREESLDAILVTKLDRNIGSIIEMKAMKLANPPSESAIAIIMNNELADAGLKPGVDLKMIYTRNHFACIQMVLVNEADACSTTSPVLNHWRNSTRSKKRKFKIIHAARSVPHTLYMVHQRVPKPDREKFKKAILSWDERTPGKMILGIFSVTSFVEAKDSDYDVIRKYRK